ncbi:MAG: alpha-glucosidase [Candidatus Cyclobacteriaceae bacterium M2_1C_046]
MKRKWWKESIVYQIYPRSYNDSDGDGIGDINGIIQKLDYIKSLGVDIIWLCPVYESPNDDNGYDISDYRAIMDEFGTMDDYDQLLSGIHDRGMRLIMDLVANHTSDEHKWFKESKKSKDNPYRNYYFWQKGKDDNPPNNWLSFFGGNAWEYDENTDEYYLHLFSKKQPDLNWENPKVRKEIYDVIRFWFEKGVDGFRMDVISVISKDLNFPDAKTDDFGEIINRHYANGPKIHDYLQEMNREVLSKYDIMTVGEGPGIDLEHGPDYVGEDRNELNMIFHFGHMYIDNGPGGKYDPVQYHLQDFKRIFQQWDDRLKNNGWGSVFLGNHDFSRIVSRFGDDQDYWRESAKMLSVLLMTMRGTVFVYQGDEIGMTNIQYDTIEDYNDIETVNAWQVADAEGKDLAEFLAIVHKQSRDNARTPFQWNNKENAGFTTGKPWLKINPNYLGLNAEDQENDPNSILNFYRKVIKFRKENLTFVYGDYEDLLPDDDNLFFYRRWDDNNEFAVILNFSSEMVDIKGQNVNNWQLLLNNYYDTNENEQLRPWEAKIFKIR